MLPEISLRRVTSMRISLLLVLNVTLNLSLVADESATSCRGVDEMEKRSLVKYLERKFGITPDMPLIVAASEFLQENCYNRLQFESLGGQKPGTLTLYLTPDHRYLVRDLLDTSYDPLLAASKAAEKTEMILTKGHPMGVGPVGGSLRLVIFSDFQCPYCKKSADILRSESILREFPQVRLIFRHFPLSTHAWARQSAEVAACIGTQSASRFWEFHNRIFDNQTLITTDNAATKLNEYAESLQGLDVVEFRNCMVKHVGANIVDADLRVGSAVEVTGTPAVFINGHLIREGIRSPEQLKARLRQYLPVHNFVEP
jgi:protein-disulfide isomerase